MLLTTILAIASLTPASSPKEFIQNNACGISLYARNFGYKPKELKKQLEAKLRAQSISSCVVQIPHRQLPLIELSLFLGKTFYPNWSKQRLALLSGCFYSRKGDSLDDTIEALKNYVKRKKIRGEKRKEFVDQFVKGYAQCNPIGASGC